MYGTHWCHMWTDGDPEELHRMADKIGLNRVFYQKSQVLLHYDLVMSKRRLAIEHGANTASLKEWLKSRHNAAKANSLSEVL